MTTVNERNYDEAWVHYMQETPFAFMRRMYAVGAHTVLESTYRHAQYLVGQGVPVSNVAKLRDCLADQIMRTMESDKDCIEDAIKMLDMVDMHVVAHYMDYEVREDVHSWFAGLSDDYCESVYGLTCDQNFLTVYIALHKAKFGESFILP